MQYSSGSIHSSGSGFAPARTGSNRPARPAQLDSAIVDHMAGGMDPETLSEISHTSAAALLDRVHHSEDPAVVDRVLTLVDREGVDIIAELWSQADPESLPGILWRLYLLRTWMRRNSRSIAQLWSVAEPEATSASAIAGITEIPHEEDIARTADAILSGAFTGDFAVALERAASFTEVIVLGLHIEARRIAHGSASRAGASASDSASSNDFSIEGADSDASGTSGNKPSKDDNTTAARLLHNAANLANTAKVFTAGARLWRQGKLE